MSNLPPINLHWTERAACIGYPDHVFFPTPGKTPNEAKTICSDCTVRIPCLNLAMTFESNCRQMRHGVFGGLSPQERADLAARRRAA